MANIQQTIIQKFLERLTESEYFDERRTGNLSKLLSDPKKLKADDIVTLLSEPQTGDFA